MQPFEREGRRGTAADEALDAGTLLPRAVCCDRFEAYLASPLAPTWLLVPSIRRSRSFVRVLQLHTRYVFPGGEDVVVDSECELLRSGGHEVEQLLATNRAFGEDRRLSLRGVGRAVAHRLSLYRELEERLTRQRPDVLHVHNTFAQLGSAIYRMAAERRVPVVQTIHNYRFACAQAALLREQRPCDECVGGSRLSALRHRCFRGSLPLTAAALGLQWDQNRAARSGSVHTFIAPSDFVRERLLRDGVDAGRIVVKPHFAPEPSVRPRDGERRRAVVYAGWMVAEKGVDLLLEAWEMLRPTDAELVMVGDGPLRGPLQERYAHRGNVRWTGWLSRQDVDEELGRSRVLVAPSRAYESFGLVVIEAFAMGTAVVAPGHGAFLELVEEGLTGTVFQPGSAADLARSLRWVLEQPVSAWERMSAAARSVYRERYAPSASLRALESVYGSAITGEDVPEEREGRAADAVVA